MIHKIDYFNYLHNSNNETNKIMNYTTIPEFPPDFVVKNVKDGNTNSFEAHRMLLAMNFEYFHSCVRFNLLESILDLDLDFESLKMCHGLIMGNVSFKENDDLEIYDGCVRYGDCDLIIGILEVYCVLLCKSKSFIRKFNTKLIKKLDVSNPNFVRVFCLILKNNNKITPDLKNIIIPRVSYLFEPTFYFEYFKNYCSEHNIPPFYSFFNKWDNWDKLDTPIDIVDVLSTDGNTKKYNTILLVVYPRKKWIKKVGEYNPRSDTQDYRYIDWGIAFYLNSLGEIINSTNMHNGNHCVGFSGLINFFIPNKIKWKNGIVDILVDCKGIALDRNIKVINITDKHNSLENVTLQQRYFANLFFQLNLKNKNMCSIVRIVYKPNINK